MEPTPAPSSAGVFLVFEGGDGAGKSTQVRLLAEALRSGGREVLLTRQPGGTPLGTSLRELVLHGEHVSPRAEALLFAADKAQHVDEVVRPALAAGSIVVCDRYTDSSLAYQGAGRDLEPDQVGEVLAWAVGGLVPDLTVLLDVPAEIGRTRRGAPPDRLEAEHGDFHERVRRRFLDLAAAAPQRYLVLDATLPPDRLHERILARLNAMAVLG
ncbi:MAG: dTMP kinase [Dermatophilaceae bacterium]